MIKAPRKAHFLLKSILDFVRKLQERGIHFSGREENAWIERNQEYFVDKTADGNENRLWMMANMGRVL
ncbi:TPA: hypothetical protein MHM75_25785 [Klebsiella pneumoniae]|nr:hypothetical protein [Klebsiella pneumoniae]